MLSSSTIERISIVAYLLLDIYRVCIGSFYTLFIPQLCTDEKGSHICTMYENTSNLSPFDATALGMNACTAFLMMFAFAFEFYRENWMVTNLAMDDAKSDDNLSEEIERYAKLKEEFLRINRFYHQLFAFVILVNCTNIVLSGIRVSHFYDGFQTLTNFGTNTLIVVLRIVKSYEISHIHRNHIKAQSVFLFESVTFNSIHPKHTADP